MDKNTREIAETLNFIVTRMVTKDDIANMATKDDIAKLRAELRAEMNEGFTSLRAEIRDIRAEIRDIHNQLDTINAELKNHAGYAKDIDHLMDRVRMIEKHLGIQHKIAA